jgi:competence ComEA-like helix-hairpin-helix protein
MKLLKLIRTCLLLATLATAAVSAPAGGEDPVAESPPPSAELLARLYPAHAPYLQVDHGAGDTSASAPDAAQTAARDASHSEEHGETTGPKIPATPAIETFGPRLAPALPPSLDEGLAVASAYDTTSATLQALQELRPPVRTPTVPRLPEAGPRYAMHDLTTGSLTGSLDLPAFLAAAIGLPSQNDFMFQRGGEANARPIRPDAVLINKAELEEIVQKLKIDARRARFIMEFRQAHGSFEHLEDLTQVNGISDSMLKAWEDRELIVLD